MNNIMIESQGWLQEFFQEARGEDLEYKVSTAT